MLNVRGIICSISKWVRILCDNIKRSVLASAPQKPPATKIKRRTASPLVAYVCTNSVRSNYSENFWYNMYKCQCGKIGIYSGRTRMCYAACLKRAQIDTRNILNCAHNSYIPIPTSCMLPQFVLLYLRKFLNNMHI